MADGSCGSAAREYDTRGTGVAGFPGVLPGKPPAHT